MDLVGYRQHDYQRIVTAYRLFAAQLGVTASVQALPLSALQGDNVVTRSSQMAWYQGPTLLELLEAIPDETGAQQAPFRLPVQLVIRHNGQAANSFRGYAGRIESGSIRVGDPIISQPGAHRAHVRVIHTWDGNLQQASAGQAVTLLLAEDLDISRGAMLADADSPPQPQTQLQADLCWLADEDLDLRHAYWLKHTTRRVIARIGSIESVLDVNTQQQHAAATLRLNDIARVTLSLQQPIAADAYADNRRCGAFILIDQLTHQTVAAGMIRLDPATPSAAAAHDATTA
jgi:sulfate adenylyltransferase subunit 1